MPLCITTKPSVNQKCFNQSSGRNKRDNINLSLVSLYWLPVKSRALHSQNGSVAGITQLPELLGHNWTIIVKLLLTGLNIIICYHCIHLLVTLFSSIKLSLPLPQLQHSVHSPTKLLSGLLVVLFSFLFPLSTHLNRLRHKDCNPESASAGGFAYIEFFPSM